ncbi:MAG: FtsX-like permease family protein [Chloroflexota bacterium]
MFFLPLHLRKIAADVWFNKTRTLLVVLTIAIGVFAVGTIFRSWSILSSNLSASYQRANPANTIFFTTEFHDDLVEAIREMPEVKDAEGRRTLAARIQVGDQHEWRTLDFTVVADYNDLRVNKMHLVDGDWPPSEGTILIERSSLGLMLRTSDQPIGKGHQFLIEMPNGRQRTMALAGVVHDVTLFPSSFSKKIYGYITVDTLQGLTGSRGYNELHVVVDSDDKAEIDQIGQQINEKMQAFGVQVAARRILDPTKHPLDNILQAILFILAALGMLALCLTALQVFNTISTLLTRQINQIGIMKAIGARPGNVLFIYVGIVLSFNGLALLIAIPMASLGARGLSLSMANLLNLDIASFNVPLQILALEWIAGLVAPLLMALIPIMGATRLTVREAIGSAFKVAQFGQSMIDQLLNQIRGLPISLLYATRNTFRHKKRLAFTLTTLTVASMIFIVVMSISASLRITINDVLNYWIQDIEVVFKKPHRIQEIERAALNIPLINRVESRTVRRGFRVYEDGTESTQRVFLYGIPPNTPFIRPTLVDGRWLLPEDQNALVINVDFLAEETDLKVGQDVTLRIEQRETSWRVVGIVTGQIIGPGGLMAPLGYTNSAYLTQATGQIGRSQRLLVEIKNYQDGEEVAKVLEEHFNALGMNIGSIEQRTEIRETINFPFQIVLTLLFFMSLLFTITGGLGLMSLMTITVLERSKELGVAQAIGATESLVVRMVMIEGVFIGILSWFLGSLLAIPLSRVLSDTIGILLVKVPLKYSFPINGILLWLVIMTVVSALATWIPARNASRVSVRQALAYE